MERSFNRADLGNWFWFLALFCRGNFQWCEDINLESTTFMKVKIIVNQGKVYTIAKRNSQVLFRNIQKYKYANYMNIMLMRLMSKSKYLILPKVTKFEGLGKLGLSPVPLSPSPSQNPTPHISFLFNPFSQSKTLYANNREVLNYIFQQFEQNIMQHCSFNFQIRYDKPIYVNWPL